MSAGIIIPVDGIDSSPGLISEIIIFLAQNVQFLKYLKKILLTGVIYFLFKKNIKPNYIKD